MNSTSREPREPREPRESRESYKHLFAKQLVAKWLRDRAHTVRLESDGDYQLINLDPVRALVPIENHFNGVYTEYPICLSDCGTSTTLHKPWPATAIPSFSELIESGRKPAYILDIAVLHMGQVKYGLEIVNKHPVPGAKIRGLELGTHNLPFELYEINADWVLDQCQPPWKLQVSKLLPCSQEARWNLPFTTSTPPARTM